MPSPAGGTRSHAWAALAPLETKRDPAVAARVHALCDAERLSSAYQPIYRASTGELEGCEALVRLPPGSGFPGPYELFEAALVEGLGVDLEIAATLRILSDAEPYVGTLRLFLNLLAPVFSDPRYDAAWLADQVVASGRVPSQVILEIPEIGRIHDYEAFGKALEPYRKEGFRIAIDDFGAGYTNLRMITDLSPDFVKIDRVFVDGIFSHARKRILVESVVALCHRINCSVVAEGIETPEDLDAVLSAGVDHLQGYLLSRPAPPEEAFVVEDLALPTIPSRFEAGEFRHLLVASAGVPAEERLGSVLQQFADQDGLEVVPVLLRGRAIGLLTRAALKAWLARTGSTLADPVSLLVEDVLFDQLPETGSLEDVADLVRHRPLDRRFEPVVMTGPGKVCRGVLRLDDLLVELVRQQTEVALRLNPVTRLPGRHQMEDAIAERLKGSAAFTFFRLNLLRFRPFNDRYGFLRGDKLLAGLGSLLKEELGKEPGSFLAHYDADDFALLLSGETGEGLVSRLRGELTRLLPEYYDPQDLAAGGFAGRDRRGALVTIHPVELVAGVVKVARVDGLSVRGVTEEAALALGEARRKGVYESAVVRYLGLAPEERPPVTRISLPRPRLS